MTGAGITLVDAYATAAYAMGFASQEWLEALEGYVAFAVPRTGATGPPLAFRPLPRSCEVAAQ